VSAKVENERIYGEGMQIPDGKRVRNVVDRGHGEDGDGRLYEFERIDGEATAY
jgi:hypothetical protein